MSKPVVAIQPDMPIMDALKLMQEKNIRRAPVVKGEKLVGIVSDKDLLNAAPSDATTLSIWEINYLLAKIKVKDVMTSKVLSVGERTPIEEAARIMADNKIGGLPVLTDDKVVGIITETDLFKIFLELMGARDAGVRVTALVPDKPGELAALTKAIADAGGSFIAFGQFEGETDDTSIVTFKVTGVEQSEVENRIKPYIERIIDIRG
jgi:acetoin utilization protein AcuB